MKASEVACVFFLGLQASKPKKSTPRLGLVPRRSLPLSPLPEHLRLLASLFANFAVALAIVLRMAMRAWLVPALLVVALLVAASSAYQLRPLRLNSDGTFKILFLTDLHFGEGDAKDKST